MRKCTDCKKEVSKGHKRCNKCYRKFNIGKNHTSYIKGKPKCINCGKLLTNYDAKRCHKHANLVSNKLRLKTRRSYKEENNPFYGKKHTRKTKKLISLAQIGEKSHTFNNWSSREPYNKEWSEELRETIRKRDHYKCQLCHKRGKPVHHIDYNKQNCKENNLITLCIKCNSKVNFNRNYYKKHFKNVIKSR